MRRTELITVSLILSVIIFSCIPLFRNIYNVNLHWDWLQMLSYYRADRVALLEYHQLPLRTFYFGGGYPLIANPQDGFLNPFFIPVLFFGEVIGMKLNVLFALLIGAYGMYYLTRHVLNYHYLGASFSTVVFCLGGHLHRLLVRGQDYMSLFWFFLPIILAFFVKSKQNKKFLFFSILVLSIFVTQAGPYFSPVLLFIFLFAILEVFKYENRRVQIDIYYLKSLFLILFFVFLLGAVKILPMLELLRQNPRIVEGYNFPWLNFLATLYKSFFLRQLDFSFVGQHWTYFYLGYIPAVIFLASCIVYWGKLCKFIILLVIFMFLSFSAGTSIDLFRLLWYLPVFHSIEAPLRYFIPVVIFLISLISGRIFSICDKFKSKFLTLFFISIIIATTADFLIINGNHADSFPIPIPKDIRRESFFQIENYRPGDKVSSRLPASVFSRRSWEWTMPTQHELMLNNIGKINWYGNIHLGEYSVPKYYVDWNGVEFPDPRNYVWIQNPDYRGEVYFLKNQDNKIKLEYFSPNRITLNIDLTEADTLVINQNYDKYWKSNLLKPINYNGLLAFKISQKGFYLIKLVYVPLSFYLGLGISLATFIFILKQLLIKKNHEFI